MENPFNCSMSSLITWMTAILSIGSNIGKVRILFSLASQLPIVGFGLFKFFFKKSLYDCLQFVEISLVNIPSFFECFWSWKVICKAFQCDQFLSFQSVEANTVTIRLSVCPLKCTILLSALFIEVKIPIKKITLFMMKLHQTKLKLCSKHSKNNKRKEFLTKKKFKRICYVMVGGVSWKCTKRNARKKRTKSQNWSLPSQRLCACYVLYVCVCRIVSR